MDRPEDIYCYNCNTCDGMKSTGPSLWLCSSCGKLNQLNKEGCTIRATQALLDVAARLEQGQQNFSQRVLPYMIPISMGRGQPSRLFPPDETTPVMSTLMTIVFLGAIGVVCLYFSYVFWGLACLAAAWPAAVWMRAGVNRKLERYQAEKARWEREKADLLKQADELVRRTS